MPKISALFFITGATFALMGMIWGIQMSATQDHTLSPAHGHLNLIGFVTITIYGIFYAVMPRAAETRLAQVHLGISVASVVVLVPGIVLAITEQGAIFAQVGSLLAVISIVMFIYVIVRNSFA